jgi:hypothetical protein
VKIARWYFVQIPEPFALTPGEWHFEGNREGRIGTHDDGDWFWLPSVISFLPFVHDSLSFNLPDI